MELNKNEIQEAIDEEIKTAEKLYGKGVKLCVLRIIGLLKMLPSESAEKQDRLIPLPLWNNYYDYPTVAGMRMKVFNAERNGFKDFGVVEREGKRVFINEQAYLNWRDRNKQKG